MGFKINLGNILKNLVNDVAVAEVVTGGNNTTINDIAQIIELGGSGHDRFLAGKAVRTAQFPETENGVHHDIAVYIVQAGSDLDKQLQA